MFRDTKLAGPDLGRFKTGFAVTSKQDAPDFPLPVGAGPGISPVRVVQGQGHRVPEGSDPTRHSELSQSTAWLSAFQKLPRKGVRGWEHPRASLSP